jgi:proprotein convertase subtilisin/kexin type 2
MLDQPYMTDLIEANSMGHEPHLIDIYSASWGPTDDGKTVDGPRNATMRAIVRGVNEVSCVVMRLLGHSIETVCCVVSGS